MLFSPLKLPPADLKDGKAFTEKFINHSFEGKLRVGNYHEDVNPMFSDFALLDVSSNANQMGVAFSHKLAYMQQLANKGVAIASDNNFPLKIEGVSVNTAGKNAQAFTMPGIAWEPLLNLSFTTNADPLPGFNYFPNDGVPSIVGNLSNEPVILAPIPLSKHLVDTFKSKKDGKTYALFNLPFGMVAFAILSQDIPIQEKKPSIDTILPEFENAIVGGIQLELVAGSTFANNHGQDLFEGYTFQLVKLIRSNGDACKKHFRPITHSNI